MSAANDAALLDLLALSEFDHKPTWKQAKPPQTTKQVTGHVRQLGIKDETLVNAYGIDAVEITCKVADFPFAPAKFDSFTVGTHKYVAQDVRTQIGFAGVPLLYRVYAKGN